MRTVEQGMNMDKNFHFKRFNISKLIVHLIFIAVTLACILPVVLILSISFSSESEIYKTGYSFIPKSFSLKAYEFVLKQPHQLITSYAVTIGATLLGTFFSMLLTSTLAYTISRKDYPYANKISFYVFFTMLFSGGLVPWYILISQTLHLKDTFFAIFLPYLVVPWFVLLMKGFFSEIPAAVIESAKIDGASEYRIFFRIILPISKAGIATVSLFCVLQYWNDYWLSLLFIESSPFVSLQLLLFRIMSNIDFLNSAMGAMSGNTAGVDLPGLTARMAMCFLAAGPILFVFPFFQKYFVKGMTVGAVKG